MYWPLVGVCAAAAIVGLAVLSAMAVAFMEIRRLPRRIAVAFVIMSVAFTAESQKMRLLGSLFSHGDAEARRNRIVLQSPASLCAASRTAQQSLTDDDFERGFVMARVGTNEVFEFAAPENAAVVSDWKVSGVAADRAYLAVGDWALKVGTNHVGRFCAYTTGVVEPLPLATNRWFAPLSAALGFAAEANWSQMEDYPSLFWHCVTPSNTLQMTWQNVLLNRDEARPMSFQAEFWESGRFAFRYDLSRLGAEEVSNVVVGAALGGDAWGADAIPTNVTSLAFYPVSYEDTTNSDRDNDGVTTEDELFVYGTDPDDADSDHDGLTDGEELLSYNTDPLNPHSIDPNVCDGVAVNAGGEDLFSYPEGSTNTVLEHLFYSGTTNGTIVLPQSSDGYAVLGVTASGYGTGELIIDGKVVPLIGRPQMRGGNERGMKGATRGANDSPTLHVQLRKGRTHTICLQGDNLPEVFLGSGDFAFGVEPTATTPGRINFPNTKATPACIHDFDTRERWVSLPTGDDAGSLTCTWSGGDDVEITQAPRNRRMAKVKALFHPSDESTITYTVSHPEYLFGQAEFEQNVRFCPKPESPDDPDEPEPDWISDWEGGYGETELGWGDYWNVFYPSQPDPDEDDPAEVCPEHDVPYEECAHLHNQEYTNAVANVEHRSGVLLIRDEPEYEEIELTVTPGAHNCCSCPDHWTNYVGLAHMTGGLSLLGENGLPFVISEESCTVYVAATSPSEEIGDAQIAFARNGTIDLQYDMTAIGVSIGGTGLDRYNAINANFGLPMTVTTNMYNAAQLYLTTNVKLSGGTVHLELKDATGKFAVWFYDSSKGGNVKLLDSQTARVKDIPIAQWRELMARAFCDSASMPVHVTSSSPGSVKLLLRYWNTEGGKFMEDEAEQVITSVKPPLLPDYNRDGVVDDKDAVDHASSRTMYFWTNHDTWRGDNAFSQYANGYHAAPITFPDNGSDNVVNGRNDLVNLCPFAVDLSSLVNAWGTGRVKYELQVWGAGEVHYVPIRAKWKSFDKIVTTEQKTVSGSSLHSATLQSLPDSKGETKSALPSELLALSESESGAIAMEFTKSGWHELCIIARDRASEEELFRSATGVFTLDVHDMYRWLNLDGVVGAQTDPKYNDRTSVYWPDQEHADVNVVFVHGYNVHPSEAWDWSQAMFKRLWWSGMDAGFTAVLWRGNESQVWLSKIPFLKDDNGFATINYHQNVLNAFRTAHEFATRVNALPGAKKYMIAHSLGNMLVSEARQNHGLQYERYFMLNAAVPAEAYDPDGSVTETTKSVMTPSDWRSYPERVRSTHWYELFEPGDERHNLTWKGLFRDVDNTINFYSTEDEVVKNGSDMVKSVLSREYAWYNQDQVKGFYLVSFSPQAGWNFSGNYRKVAYEYEENGMPKYLWRRYSPEETESISNESLKVAPFFRGFRDVGIYGDGGSDFLASHDEVRWYALSHGIPTESFSAGANPVPKWGGNNVDMATECVPEGHEGEWVHSYFIDYSLFDTHVLYKKIVKQIGTTTKGGNK